MANQEQAGRTEREAVPLNAANLRSLPEGVAVPTYDRSAVTPGIVHFGVGGFHRAHQAMYLDQLMNNGEALDWGIVGVGVLEHDKKMADVFAASDCLYTLMVKEPDGTQDLRVIGSIIDYRYAPDDPAAVVDLLADPQIRIVSLTITEGGYNFHHVTGEYNAGNPLVSSDVENPEAPRTVFGLVVRALQLRRERGIAPFTVMTCDNIPENGHVARKSFVSHARLVDAELADWIDAEVPFPNSMVDRITPATTAEDIAAVAGHGVADQWPVVCEPFTQWALEDNFVDGKRPGYDTVGVQVVEDVTPYELMKLRLLNATHQGLCYFGHLAGYRLVHDVARDPDFAAFLLAYMRQEGEPTLPEVPGVDLATYQQTLIERYSNEYVRDTVARLCAESSDRIPKWLLPVIRENIAAGRPVTLSAAVVASWARYAEGVDEEGEPIKVVDQLADQLVPLARQQRDDPLAFVKNTEVFGDLAEQQEFTQPYLATLESLHQKGSRRTLGDIVAALE